jgi:RNA recognition motif-containing protein
MSKKIYVGNLAFSSSEASVKDLFSQFGEVLSVKIPTDQMTGRSRGFCFVEMENADGIIEQLNGTEFEGRVLKVDYALERQNGSRFGSRGLNNRNCEYR